MSHFGSLRPLILPALAMLCMTAPAPARGQGLAAAASDDGLARRVRIVTTSRPNDKGEGLGARLASLTGPPKRVGLVSFYVNDQGSGTGTYYSSRRQFNFLTQDGASHFAERYADRGISTLRDTLAAYGMELLTPEQFLDSPEKREAYRTYQLDMGRIARALLGAMNNLATADVKGVSLSAIELMLYGPSPVPKRERVRYIRYLPGVCYVNAILELRRPVQLAKFNRREIAEEDYAGYEQLLGTLAGRAAAYLKEEIEKE